MNTDQKLIDAILDAAATKRHVTADDHHDIDLEIVAYEAACGLSRGPDSGRAAFWSIRARERYRELQNTYYALVGRSWQSCSETVKVRKELAS